MPVTRRVFLRDSALAVVGTAAIPRSLTRAAYSAVSHKRLVVVFQRGGADGLNLVVPHGEPAYYALRPSISIPRNAVIDLDGFFGLHPSLSALQPLWKARHLAIVHAAGSPDPTPSHFAAQDFMESGTPGVRTTEDGWLNRALRSLPTPTSAFRAIAPGPSLPRMLCGPEPAVAMSNLGDFGAVAKPAEALKMLKSADPAKYTPARGVHYPPGRFAHSLRHLAQLIKANLGVQVAFTDIGGWDHHVNEGGTQGRMADILHDFSLALAAFWIDLGNLAEDTVVVTLSEFGRSARENANRGTGHGYGNVMLVMGGPVKGGRVYGRWPGLDSSQLDQGRDLAITTDFRRVLGEVVYRHLGNSALHQVFPGFDNQTRRFAGLIME